MWSLSASLWSLIFFSSISSSWESRVLLADLLKPLVVLLVLLVEAAEVVVRLEELRLQIIVLRHGCASFACR